MIQHVFPEIESTQPFRHKVQTPYTKLFVTDTPNTVKSHGFTARWFIFPTFLYAHDMGVSTTDNLVWTGIKPIAKLFSGQAYPVEVAQDFFKGEQFGMSLIGYFRATASSGTFFLKGNGSGEFKLTGDFTGDSDPKTTGTVVLGQTNNTFSTLGVSDFVIGNDYAIGINYLSSDKFSTEQRSFVASYVDSSYPKEVPLSAGNVYSLADGPGGINISTASLHGVSKINITRSKKQITKLTFQVPVVSSSASAGFKYVPAGDYFENVEDSSETIKKFRMIEFHSGYVYPSGTIATLTKFTGQIRDWKLSKRADGKTLADIECFDWSIFLSDAFNEGYPNVADYLLFNYTESRSLQGVDGLAKPRTFDGWKLEDAVDNLLINAGIDSFNLGRRRKVITVDQETVDGPYTVYDKNKTDEDDKVFLDVQPIYGNSISINPDSSDDKYLWQFSIGEDIADNIQSLADNYGYSYGFNNKGDFVWESVKTPIESMGIDDLSYSGTLWTERLDSRMLEAVSIGGKTNLFAGGEATLSFQGVGAQLIFSVGPNTGYAAIQMTNPTLGVLLSAIYDTSNNATWSYFEGVQDTKGYNPCILNLSDNLDYGTYNLSVSWASGPTIYVNSVFVFDKEYQDPADTFYTADSGGERGTVVDGLSFTSGGNNVRNDVLVVGKSKGFNSSYAVSEEAVRITNPHNPTEDRVLARALDRVSMGSIASNNFTGRQLQTIIIEPKIATDDRALWLAGEAGKRYNEFDNSISANVNLVGNPLIEIGDYIKVKDVGTGVLGTNHSFWVSNVVDNYTKEKYTTSLTLESFEPWASYFKYPNPSLGRFDGSPFMNVFTWNGSFSKDRDSGFIPQTSTTLAVNLSDAAVAVIVSINVGNDPNNAIDEDVVGRMIPSTGFLKVGSEVIKYEGFSVMTTQNVFYHKSFWVTYAVKERAMFRTVAAAVTRGGKVEIEVSPYMDVLNSPAVTYDLLFPGFIRVSIVSSRGVLVDTLTGNPNSINRSEGWEFVRPGRYKNSWGMIDRRGTHNNDNAGVFTYQGLRIQHGDLIDTPSAPTKEKNLGSFREHFNTQRAFPGQGQPGESKYVIGQDSYVTNIHSQRFGKFEFRIEYTDPTKRVMPHTFVKQDILPINTILRHSGAALDRDFRYEGIDEEFKFGEDLGDLHSSISTIDISSEWAAPDHLLDFSQWRPAPPKYFYTGLENQGRGLQLRIRNYNNERRIVNLSIERFNFVFAHITRDGGITEEVLKGTENILSESGFIPIGGEVYDQIYLPAPSEGYIPDEWEAFKQKHLTIGGSQDIDWIGISHLHLFKIIAIDYSGRKSEFRKAIWWVHDQFHNTAEDWQGDSANLQRYRNRPTWKARVYGGTSMQLGGITAGINGAYHSIHGHREYMVEGDTRGLYMDPKQIPFTVLWY